MSKVQLVTTFFIVVLNIRQQFALHNIIKVDLRINFAL